VSLEVHLMDFAARTSSGKRPLFRLDSGICGLRLPPRVRSEGEQLRAQCTNLYQALRLPRKERNPRVRLADLCPKSAR